jgi:hypothetical protein
MERTEGNRILSRIEPISFFISELPEVRRLCRTGHDVRGTDEVAVMEDKGAEV